MREAALFPAQRAARAPFPAQRAARALGLGLALLAGCGAEAGAESDVLGPGDVVVELGIRHSRFELEEIKVRLGTEVRFVLVNDDPINHELIVGDEQLHQRHENGSEPYHSPRPGEVSVGPNDTAETTFVFDQLGEVEFACHLPRHYDYGMRGTVIVSAE